MALPDETDMMTGEVVGAWGSDGQGHGVHLPSFSRGQLRMLNEMIDSLEQIMVVCKDEAEKQYLLGNMVKIAKLEITWEAYNSVLQTLKNERDTLDKRVNS